MLNANRYSLLGRTNSPVLDSSSYSLLGHNRSFSNKVSRTFAHNHSFLNKLGNVISDVARMTVDYNLQKWRLKQEAKLRKLQMQAGLAPTSPPQYSQQPPPPVDSGYYPPPPPPSQDNTNKYLLFGGVALGVVAILLLTRR